MDWTIVGFMILYYINNVKSHSKPLVIRYKKCIFASTTSD